MKIGKIISRFLQRNDQERYDILLQNLYIDWKSSVDTTLKIEQITHTQIIEICDFFTELDQFLEHGKFCDIGFFILTREFFNKGSFKFREQFMRELIRDWKLNSEWKRKKKVVDKVDKVISFLRELNRQTQTWKKIGHPQSNTPKPKATCNGYPLFHILRKQSFHDSTDLWKTISHLSPHAHSFANNPNHYVSLLRNEFHCKSAVLLPWLIWPLLPLLLEIGQRTYKCLQFLEVVFSIS